MARNTRWSKEDLDNTFEAFLRTSLSSEDDTEKIKEMLDKPVAAKRRDKDVSSASLWWANDSDDESLKKSTSTGKSFLKLKKSESPARPKNGSNSHTRGYERGSDITFSSGDVEPVITTSTPKQQQVAAAPRKAVRKDKPKNSPGKTRNSKPIADASMSRDSLEDISEKSEEHDQYMLHERGLRGENNVISVHDSSIDTSASYEGVQRSKDPPGFDTLNEMADKQEFFQNLENDANGTVDYGRLNQELSQTGTTMMSPATRKMLANASVVSGDSMPDTPARNPQADVTTDSSHKPSMLSKVALLDSMDSTLNTTTSPKIINSRDTTQENLGTTLPDTLKTQGTPGLSGHMGTNTSREMEDLQRVLKEAGLSPTIYSGDSRPPTVKAANSNQATPVHHRREVDRSVGDIIREMDAIHSKGQQIELEEDKIHLKSDYRSPRSPRSPGLKRQPNMEDLGGFDHSHTEDTEVYQPVTAVGNWRMKKSVKEKKSKLKRTDSSDRNNRSISKAPSEERAHTARERFSHVQSSGYGQSTSPSGRKSRSRSAGKSPQRKPSSQTQGQRNGKSASQKFDSRTQLVSPPLTMQSAESTNDVYIRQSVERFAKHMKDCYENESKQASYQATSEWLQQTPGHERETAMFEELRDVREQWNVERTLKVKLQAELASQEKEFKNQIETQKLKYEDTIFSLKQENFVLAAKLKELESPRKGGDSEGVDGNVDEGSNDKGLVAKLEKSIQEQESLLAGYQAENKRLYEEMKGMQRQAKGTETSMFKENQRLTAELSSVKQELELKNTELQNKGIITSVAVQQQIAAGNMEAAVGSNRISHLEGELTEAKRVQESQNREVRNLQQNKFELERHVEGLLKERDGLVKELGLAMNPEQIKEMEFRHKDELKKLQDKIRWYVENQELLDKSKAKLKGKDEEIHRLKMRLEDFKSEAGRKLEENKIRSKEKAADNKKIQDLERQVKEMESVIRRRHPNSLPAMMMVAASIPDAALEGSQVKGRSVQVLESCIKKLEKQLEEKDDLAQQDLRAMEQKYNHIKLQFEERISDLETQLSFYQVTGADGHTKSHPHSHALALERELDSVRERSKKQVLDMQNEINRLGTELNKVQKNQDNLMKNETKQLESEWRQQIKSLQRELKDREHDVQMLHNTVEKMRGRQDPSRKKGSNHTSKMNGSDWPAFPHAPSSSREYQPQQFADNDMSELLQENQQLKIKLEQIQLQLDQQRVDLRRSLAETELVARQNKERLENHIEELRSSHQHELQRVMADHALHSSTSRVSELQNKCETQEVMIKHLQSQLKKAAMEAELMRQLKAKDAELTARNEELQAKIKELKTVQAPEMRHFESLEDKLTSLAERQRRREMDLDSMVKQNQQTCRAGAEEEVTKWKRMVEAKNKQLEVFRAELDSILEVLKTLQRQGVILPVSAIYS